MKFADLRDMSLPEFVEQSRDPSAFWFFLHVPKTAGSSFGTEMGKRLKPRRNIHIDRSRNDLGHDDNLRHSLETFLALPGRKRFRSASGHLEYPWTQRLRDTIPNTRMVTFLRAPEQRVISGYRYQRSAAHRSHEEFKRNFPTLESFVESPRSQDRMARFAGGEGIDLKPLLRRIEEDYAFVGLLEMYPMSFNVAFDIMGVPDSFPATHKNKTLETEDTAIEVTPAILKRIRELNALDVALYEHVHAILAPHQQAWEAGLARAAPVAAPAA